MMPSKPLLKAVPISNEQPGHRQQLPPVSYILGGRSYHDLVPTEHQPSQLGLAIFHRPHYSRGSSGEITPGPPGFYGHSSHDQSFQTHYCNRSDLLPVSLFTHTPPPQEQAPRDSSVPSLLSTSDGSTSSGSDTFDQPRVPRVIREEELPGKGTHDIYDDGTYCPKAIDGESVNRQWGFTKAGRPRKRLAQACTTCREKKIRCDPGSGTSECSQCLKFSRKCRFEQQQT